MIHDHRRHVSRSRRLQLDRRLSDDSSKRPSVERRDLRTQYLLDAFRRLEGAGNRSEPTREDEKALESSVADIQLLGSPEQVQLARQFALDFARDGRASLDPLLESLRAELRKELGLGPLDHSITFLRIVRRTRHG